MDIKHTPLALLMTVTLSTGCYANDNNPYCRNGGSSTSYTCDESAQRPDKAPVSARALASTDEAWMRSKLAEIKTWLQQEKGETFSTETNQVPSASLQVRQPAASDPELMRIESLSRAGKHRGAMSAVNSYMAAHPDSLEGLLTKSLVLNNMGQLKEAEALLQNTIIQHPSSPEAYNNLAVLYAGQNNYGKAIETLLEAFRTNPTYAQIHQNLRELYAAVASQAYTRALDLNTQETNAPKLVMLRRTTEQAPKVDYQVAALASTTQQSTPPTPSTPPVAAAVVEASPSVEQAAPAIKPAAPTAAVSATAPPVATTLTEKQLVDEAVTLVESWAAAWQRQDVAGYVNAYTATYHTDGLSHHSWKAQRQQRLSKPTFIQVRLESLRTRILSASTAQVEFTQHYRSNTYQDVTHKRLELTRVGQQWKIADERSL